MPEASFFFQMRIIRIIDHCGVELLYNQNLINIWSKNIMEIFSFKFPQILKRIDENACIKSLKWLQHWLLGRL